MKNKAIVFDFDGTLTKQNQNIWKMLWQQCNYPTDKNSLYAKLYVSHNIKKEITRKQWFDLTCLAFKKRNLSIAQFYDVAKQIQLINGFKQTIKTLHKNGYQLHIVSGCIKEAIEIVLGDYRKYFTFIESNKVFFGKNGKIKCFIPTNFDYEGKAKYIENLKNNGIKAEDIVFVGNSDNDEWTYTTGCKTICINPDAKADSKNNKKWHVVIDKLTNLKQILPFVLNKEATEQENLTL